MEEASENPGIVFRALSIFNQKQKERKSEFRGSDAL